MENNYDVSTKSYDSSFAIILSSILFWATSNVCRYNFAIEKKTNQLNIIAQEIDPSIPMAKVYYFKELNCNNVEFNLGLRKSNDKLTNYISNDLSRAFYRHKR